MKVFICLLSCAALASAGFLGLGGGSGGGSSGGHGGWSSGGGHGGHSGGGGGHGGEVKIIKVIQEQGHGGHGGGYGGGHGGYGGGHGGGHGGHQEVKVIKVVHEQGDKVLMLGSLGFCCRKASLSSACLAASVGKLGLTFLMQPAGIAAFNMFFRKVRSALCASVGMGTSAKVSSNHSQKAGQLALVKLKYDLCLLFNDKSLKLHAVWIYAPKPPITSSDGQRTQLQFYISIFN
uniref:DUF4766 domain-containing protein n=1 Tax=Megaselia scalaris TaxID=36166 RepID=T1GCN3_MEGSC